MLGSLTSSGALRSEAALCRKVVDRFGIVLQRAFWREISTLFIT